MVPSVIIVVSVLSYSYRSHHLLVKYPTLVYPLTLELLYLTSTPLRLLHRTLVRRIEKMSYNYTQLPLSSVVSCRCLACRSVFVPYISSCSLSTFT